MNTRLFVTLCLLAATVTPGRAQTVEPIRPPAVPLVAHSPYFSIWSMGDKLTDDFPRHWTGSVQAMTGMARIDGKPFRVMGPKPESIPALPQTGLDVTPTKSAYRFDGAGVRLTLTFLSPLLPRDLDVLSRPVTYLTWTAQATDGKPHAVTLYFDATGELAVNTPDQKVAWEKSNAGNLVVQRIGTTEQPILARVGDGVRIDWGYFYVASPAVAGSRAVVASDTAARDGFAQTGMLPAEDDSRQPRAANDDWPVLARTFDLGRIGGKPVARHLLLAYDEIDSIQLMGKNLRSFWRRNGMDAPALLQAAERDYPALSKRCAAFDKQLAADLTRVGGPAYARLAILSYRQCWAAHGMAVDERGRPLLFAKENFSNGCISTVDIIYPSAPFFLLFNTELLKAQLTPVLDYAESPRWKFPFAPHDLGTYPKANGQVYGGGERDESNQMPVEESGNMLLILAAMAKIDGNAKYANAYWPQLSKWATYLKEKGLDPENQLCTDDFAGHLAHNTNLSVKAIEALGGYALLCDMTGRKAEGDTYRAAARDMAAKWQTMARDGDHFKLAFDKSGTWSQKYNLVWDKLIGLNLFPETVAQMEIAFYKTKQNEFGLPLDNRRDYTKLDWTVWTATLAQSPADFAAIVTPVDKFAQTSPSRVPLTDWYGTVSNKKVGFQARSVVGGVFIKMLSDPRVWAKYAAQK